MCIRDSVIIQPSGIAVEHVVICREYIHLIAYIPVSYTHLDVYKRQIYKCINCLLKHSLLISHDDLRSTEIKESAETIISVDDSSVQIVEV